MAMGLLFFMGCRDGGEESGGTPFHQAELVVDQLSKKAVINPKAREIISGWPEFISLENSLDGLYRVENQEELSLLLDELIDKEKALADSEYPEFFASPQIYSRQKVFKTFLLKTKASIIYRTDPQEPAEEMIQAYNDLCTQFNVLVNNQLDKKLLDEESDSD